MALLPSIQITLKLGVGTPTAAPRALMEALESVEVTAADEGPMGMQLVFRAGRGARHMTDDPVVTAPELALFSRVRLILSVKAVPYVLFEGVITNQQFTPSTQPGASTFALTCEDLTWFMDQVEFPIQYPSLTQTACVALACAPYAIHGIVPLVIPSLNDEGKPPTDQPRSKTGSDLAFIQEQAQKLGYVFYLTPGPVEGMTTAYFGPSIRAGVPQRALTWNAGPSSNLHSVDFQHDGTKPHMVYGWVKDDNADILPYMSLLALRQPMASQPTHLVKAPFVKTTVAAPGEGSASGNDAWKKAMVDAAVQLTRSTDAVVTASAEVDGLRYGQPIQARGLIDLRGVGTSYDGSWYVKSVTHSIRRGEYKQKVSLERDGLGALLNKVVQP